MVYLCEIAHCVMLMNFVATGLILLEDGYSVSLGKGIFGLHIWQGSCCLLRTGKKKRLGILPPLLGPSFCLEWICLYLPKNVGVGVSNLVSATRYPQPRVERAHAVGNTTRAFASWNSQQQMQQ